MTQTKKGYPGPPAWGFGVGLTTPHSKKIIVTKVDMTGQSPQWAVVPVEEGHKKRVEIRGKEKREFGQKEKGRERNKEKSVQGDTDMKVE
jgi:hypothetical protein